MALVIYKGAQAPESLTFRVAGVGLSVVSDASIHVRLVGGASQTWAGTVAWDAAGCTITHTFGGTETDTVGSYTAQAFLTVPGGTIRSAPVSFTIADPLP